MEGEDAALLAELTLYLTRDAVELRQDSDAGHMERLPRDGHMQRSAGARRASGDSAKGCPRPVRRRAARRRPTTPKAFARPQAAERKQGVVSRSRRPSSPDSAS